MEKLNELEKIIGLRFKNKELLAQAMTHKSHAHSHGKKDDNERLEFLGDSVLNLVIADWLFYKYPNYDEGSLTRLKASIVSRKALQARAKKLKLRNFVFIEKNECISDTILGDTLESLIGAIYRDQGIEKVRKFILSKIAIGKTSRALDYKSRLQEMSQRKFKVLPEYKLRSQTGPEHKKTFKVEVKIKRRIYGQGKGLTKKDAEQESAKAALKNLKEKDKEG